MQAIAAGEEAACHRVLNTWAARAVLLITEAGSESTARINPGVAQLQMLALLGHTWTLRAGRPLALPLLPAGALVREASKL